MQDLYAETRHRFVVVIDEWDSVFRERQSDRDGQRRYLDFLRDWLKDKECISLAYMTGILPIKKHGRLSALNMFWECSMTEPQQFAPYVGFTAEEVHDECERRGLNHKAFRRWYDGYRLSNVASRDLLATYYCERRDGEFGAKKHDVFVVYMQLELCFDDDVALVAEPTDAKGRAVRTVSADEGPGTRAFVPTGERDPIRLILRQPLRARLGQAPGLPQRCAVEVHARVRVEASLLAQPDRVVLRRALTPDAQGDPRLDQGGAPRQDLRLVRGVQRESLPLPVDLGHRRHRHGGRAPGVDRLPGGQRQGVQAGGHGQACASEAEAKSSKEDHS